MLGGKNESLLNDTSKLTSDLSWPKFMGNVVTKLDAIFSFAKVDKVTNSGGID